VASVSKREWTYKGEKKSAWIVRYVDHSGKHRQQTFEKKKDADLFRSKVEIDLSKKIQVAERFTIKEVAGAFLRTMQEKVKDGRIGKGHEYRVESTIRLHILPYIGEMRIDQVTLPRLEEWFQEMRQARNLSARSAIIAAQSLKMIFDHAVKREWIFKNPVLALLSEVRGAKTSPVKTFTVDQVRALLTAVNAPMYKGRTPDAALRLQCAVHLSVFCGLRLGEIFGLRVSNVDFARGILRVRTSLSRRDGLKSPKSKAGVRDVALPAHVAELLAEWIEKYQVPTGKANPQGLMFTYRSGKPMDANGFRHGSWGPLLVRAGLAENFKKPTFHFHALRHFAASWMIENGWSLPEVANALGHSKVDMTMSVYAHALQNRITDTSQMQALSDRLTRPAVIALPSPAE